MRTKLTRQEAKDGCSVYVKDANGMWLLFAICNTPAAAVEAARYLRDSKQMETVTR
jgi:hypothetical protein